MREFAVIGGGIGGCLAAALLQTKNKDVVLFEKEGYLGGCASTFSRHGRRYNAGATTLSGFSDGERVKKIFDEIGAYPDIIETDPAIVVIHKEKRVRRFRDLGRFLDEIQTAYPHPKHNDFWEKVVKIQSDFYEMSGYCYQGGSTFKKAISLLSFAPLVAKFFPLPMLNGKKWVESFYGKLTKEYEDFLNAQILIVAQAKMEQISALAVILSLGYAFRATHYPVGGMGRVCDTSVSKVKDIRKNTEIISINKTKNWFLLRTKYEEIKAENIVFAGSIFDNTKIFLDTEIRCFFEGYKHLDNRQSAFALYMSVKTEKNFCHHYQLISNEQVEGTISKAVFVSFSDPSDTLLAKSGEYSITASIHVNGDEWLGLSKNEYETKKSNLTDFLIEWICDRLKIDKSEITDSFAATPKTFFRYTKRVQLGGNPMSLANPVFRLPPNTAKVKGVYQVGDTTYPAQGWPGVAAGVENMLTEI